MTGHRRAVAVVSILQMNDSQLISHIARKARRLSWLIKSDATNAAGQRQITRAELRRALVELINRMDLGSEGDHDEQ